MPESFLDMFKLFMPFLICSASQPVKLAKFGKRDICLKKLFTDCRITPPHKLDYRPKAKTLKLYEECMRNLSRVSSCQPFNHWTFFRLKAVPSSKRREINAKV